MNGPVLRLILLAEVYAFFFFRLALNPVKPVPIRSMVAGSGVGSGVVTGSVPTNPE